MNGPGEAVSWIPPLCILGIGIVVGAVLAWRARAGSRAKQRNLPAEVRDLAARRDVLIRQLQDLEETAGKRTAAQLARDRQALELEAARVLLLLEDAGAAAPAPAPEAPARTAEPAPARAAMRGFWWGAASATAVLLVGLFVYLSVAPRGAGAPVTGNLPSGEAPQEAAAAGDEAELKEAVARNPSDLDALLALAELHLQRRDYMSVWNEAGSVLQRDPGNPRALTYEAVVRLAMGQAAIAADLLKKAIAADPALLDARVYLAQAYATLGKMEDARATIATAKRRFPERAADLQQALAELREERPPAQPGADPHAGLAIPATATSAAPRPAGGVASGGSEALRTSGGRHIAGTIELEPSLRSAAPPAGVLFVFVRAAHAEGGPPIAVKRLPAIFPAAFDLGQADSMMGQEFPDRLVIEARLDSDGNPMTRDPADPKARIDDVASGRTDLRLVLKRR